MFKNNLNTNSNRLAVNNYDTMQDQNSSNCMFFPKFIDDASKIEFKVAMYKLDIIKGNTKLL